MILITGACVGGWALLALMGAERQRMLNEAEATRRRLAPPAFNLPKPHTPKSPPNPLSSSGTAPPTRLRPAGAAQKAR